MSKDLLLYQANKTAKKNAESTAKAQTHKKVKSLNQNGALNFKLLALNEKEGKIMIDQKEINNILLNIERTRQGEHHRPEMSKITLAELKKRMSIINSDFPVTDLQFLFQGKNEITSKELYELLNENEFNDIDPVSEAIKLLCDDKDNFDFDKVDHMMQGLGYGRLDKQDKSILTEMLDVNHDLKVDKNDLKEIMNYVVQKQKHH